MKVVTSTGSDGGFRNDFDYVDFSDKCERLNKNTVPCFLKGTLVGTSDVIQMMINLFDLANEEFGKVLC